MDSDVYMEIVDNVLIPFGLEKYDGEFFLHQDNSPVHRSDQCKAQIEEKKIRWVSKETALCIFYMIIDDFSHAKKGQSSLL